MIGVINYGLGNIQSFLNSYRLLGVKAIQVKNTLELVRHSMEHNHQLLKEVDLNGKIQFCAFAYAPK